MRIGAASGPPPGGELSQPEGPVPYVPPQPFSARLGRGRFSSRFDYPEAEPATSAGKSAAIIWGGGSPKNFLLQTEPQLQEILGFQITGHDYFIQVTDARPDTGGLSGATPSEAVTWSKINPSMLPNTIVCYADITIVMPLVLAYLLQKGAKRQPKHLYDLRNELVEKMKQDFINSPEAPSSKPGVNNTVQLLKQQYKHNSPNE